MNDLFDFRGGRAVAEGPPRPWPPSRLRIPGRGVDRFPRVDKRFDWIFAIELKMSGEHSGVIGYFQ